MKSRLGVIGIVAIVILLGAAGPARAEDESGWTCRQFATEVAPAERTSTYTVNAVVIFYSCTNGSDSILVRVVHAVATFTNGITTWQTGVPLSGTPPPGATWWTGMTVLYSGVGLQTVPPFEEWQGRAISITNGQIDRGCYRCD